MCVRMHVDLSDLCLFNQIVPELQILHAGTVSGMPHQPFPAQVLSSP